MVEVPLQDKESIVDIMVLEGFRGRQKVKGVVSDRKSWVWRAKKMAGN
jgi:hypothetical protein